MSLKTVGERLRRNDAPAEADLVALSIFRGQHLPALIRVFDGLRDISDDRSLYCSGRLKNTSTILEKLRRSKTRLSTMQDIAGLRLVFKEGFEDQNAVVERVCKSNLLSNCKIHDLRDKPHSGYRALHVVGRADGYFRTHLQHLWAQVFERFADEWGRGIRYGELPVNPGEVITINNAPATKQEVLDFMMSLSEEIQKSQAKNAEENMAALREVLHVLSHESSAKNSPRIQAGGDQLILVIYDRKLGKLQQRFVGAQHELLER
jgi:ppGpp synthetase/RelA/SpoT-type nucleotidyltranferase